MENLKIHSVLKSASKNKRVSVQRDINIFIFRISGAVRYTFENKSFDVTQNEAIFIPKGENYIFSKLTDNRCEYVSIRFDANLENPIPFTFSFEEFDQHEELLNNMEELWKFGGKSEHYKCYSIFYNLLSYVETRRNISYQDKKKMKIISPGIKF